jgi:uncharacterized membrane protein (UPF0182 family)
VDDAAVVVEPGPFGKADPVLGYDAATYVFTLPALELLRGVGMGLVLLAAAGVSALYFASGQVVLTPFGLRIDERPRRHLAWLATALFLVLALGAWLSRLQEIVEASGIIQGANYADAHGRLPAALALMAASIVAAGLSIATALGRSNRHVITGAALYAVVLLAGEGYASALQRFVVTPNEQVRETPFMEYNIAATREAYALDQVEERELRGEAALTKKDIENNRARSRTCACGITSRCSRHSGRSRNSHLLRLRLGRQRSLPDQRPEPPGDALGTRAQSGGAAQSHLGQRTAGLHARPRP